MAQPYIDALLSDSKCLRCLSDPIQFQIQTYIIAKTANLGLDPNALADLAKCMKCLSPVTLVEIKAYLLATLAQIDTTPQALLDRAKCYECIPDGSMTDVQTYLLMQDPAGPGIQNTNDLAFAARAFQTLPATTLLEIQVYLLAVNANVTTDPNALALLAKCMKCVPFPTLSKVLVEIIDFLEPIPPDSPRITIPPPDPGRGTGNNGHRGGVAGCTDTLANLTPVLTPTYVGTSLTTVSVLIPRTCCNRGTVDFKGSNSIDMTGAVTVTTKNVPDRTGNYTTSGIDLSIYAYNFFAAQSDCKGGALLGPLSNVVGKTWLPQDSFETYSNGADLNGLNGGATWNGAYVSRANYLDILASDTMESYSNGAAVNGLNGGTGWAGAYVAR